MESPVVSILFVSCVCLSSCLSAREIQSEQQEYIAIIHMHRNLARLVQELAAVARDEGQTEPRVGTIRLIRGIFVPVN